MPENELPTPEEPKPTSPAEPTAQPEAAATLSPDREAAKTDVPTPVATDGASVVVSTQEAETKPTITPASADTTGDRFPLTKITIDNTIGSVMLVTAMVLSIAGYAAKDYVRETYNEAVDPTDQASVEKITEEIQKYKDALKACQKTPTEEMAEELNAASKMATLYYLASRPKLGHMRTELSVDLCVTHELAMEALQKVEPRTRMIVDYENRVNVRYQALLFKGMGNEEEYVKTWKDSMAVSDERNKKLMPMTDEERTRYWRELVKRETPKK